MPYELTYPIGLHVAGQRIAIVGGDDLAVDKVERLLGAQANVTVFAPSLDAPELVRWVRDGRIQHEPRWIEPSDVKRFRLVLVLRPDTELSTRIAAACRAEGVLVNCFDNVPLSDFSHPSLVRRGWLQIAIFTSGASPALGQRIRRGLERAFDDTFVRFLERLARLRDRVKEEEPEFEKRRAALQQAVDGFEFDCHLRYPSNPSNKMEGSRHG